MATTLFGHTAGVTGELTETALVHSLMSASHVVDVIDWLGESFEPLANLNLSLALASEPILDGSALPYREDPPGKRIVVFTWTAVLGALFATGIHTRKEVWAKFTTHLEEEQILKPLFEPAHLLLAESYLAYQKGREAGFNNIVHLPPVYATYPLQKVERHVLTIGMISRLEYGKNVEYALEACRRLQKSGLHFHVILKGDFPAEPSCLDYDAKMRAMLAIYEHESWFHWDRTFSTHGELMQLMSRFDIGLNLSGAEGGSRAVIEMMSLGIPVIVPEASSYPYLFRGGVEFVQKEKLVRASLSFYTPQLDDVVEKLKELITDESKRQSLGRAAKLRAEMRFSQHRWKQRWEALDQGKRDFWKEDKVIYEL